METIYTPADRLIIEYHDGKEPVRADPRILKGRMSVAAAARGTSVEKIINGANLDRTPGKIATEEEVAEAYQSMEALCIIVTEVFDLKLAPETAKALGLQTEPGCADMAHCIGVVDSFYRYLEKKNPPTDETPAFTPSTASISATPPITSTSSV